MGDVKKEGGDGEGPPWKTAPRALPPDMPWKEEAAARRVKPEEGKEEDTKGAGAKPKSRGASRKKEEDDTGAAVRVTADVKLEKIVEESVHKALTAVRKARVHQRNKEAATEEASVTIGSDKEEGAAREICMRHYAAVGYGDTASTDPLANIRQCGSKYYGLIDSGPGPRASGTRCLIMHSPPMSLWERHGKPSATDRVRTGAILQARSTEEGGGSARLRVLFTTPERYYAPGARVTTLRIGVDAADWGRLVPKRPRII